MSKIILFSLCCIVQTLVGQHDPYFQRFEKKVQIEESLLSISDSTEWYFTKDLNKTSSLYSFYHKMASKYPKWHLKGDSMRSSHAALYRWHSFELLGYDIDLSERLIDTAILLSENVKDSITYYKCFYNYGTVSRIKGEYLKALKSFEKYERFFSNPFDSSAIANVSYQIATVHKSLGQFDKSVQRLIKSIRIDEQLNRPTSARWALEALGSNYRHIKRYEDALEVYDKATSIFHELKDSVALGRVMFNKANVYRDMNQVNQAIDWNQKAIDILKNQKSRQYIGSAYESLGLSLMKANRLIDAEVALENALQINLIHNEQKHIDIARVNLAQIKLRLKKNKTSINLLNKAYPYLRKNGEMPMLLRIADIYVDAYEGLGSFKKANSWNKAYRAISDSIFSKEMILSVNDIKEKYETEKKEIEIQRLSLEDELNQNRISQQKMALTGSILGLSILSFLFYRLFGQNKKIQYQNSIISKALSEKETLLREIHHRVKNNLQVISSLLRIQSHQTDDEVAVDALKDSQSRVQSMSLIHQDLYQHENLTGINMKTYLEKLTSSLFNTYTINSDHIRLKLDIDDINMDVDSVVPIGLVINELVTNSIKYAFLDNQTGKVTVSFKSEDGKIKLIVSDNGIGIPPNKISSGFGRGLINSFVKKLEGEIMVRSDSGTHVTISFPHNSDTDK